MNHPTRLVRCTQCRHHRDRGTWCPEARKHAGGRYLRRCDHYAPLVPDWLNLTECAAMLRAWPAVAEAFECDGRLWLRFARHATSEERDRVAEALTGRRPQLRAQSEREPKRECRHRPQAGANHGGTAA